MQKHHNQIGKHHPNKAWHGFACHATEFFIAHYLTKSAVGSLHLSEAKLEAPEVKSFKKKKVKRLGS
jgi:hypothetical protein